MGTNDSTGQGSTNKPAAGTFWSILLLICDLCSCHWLNLQPQRLPLPALTQPAPLEPTLTRYCPEHQVPPPTMHVQSAQDTWNLLQAYHDYFWQHIQACPAGQAMQERKQQILRSAQQGPWRPMYPQAVNIFVVGDSNTDQWVIKPNRLDDLSAPLERNSQPDSPLERYPFTRWQSIPAGTAIIRDLGAEIISVGLGFDSIRPTSIPLLIEVPKSLDGEQQLLVQELCSAQAYVPDSFTLEAILLYAEQHQLQRDAFLKIIEQHIPATQREQLIVFLAVLGERDQDYHNLLLRSIEPGTMESWFTSLSQQQQLTPSLLLSIVDNGACLPEMKPESTPIAYNNITWLQDTLHQPISATSRKQFSAWQHSGVIYKTKRLLETLPLLPGDISTAPKGLLQRAQCFMLEGQRKGSRYVDLLDACVPNLMMDISSH